MKLLSVKRMGDAVQGVRLNGDKYTQAEPDHFRVTFPGGDVDIARCTDDTYWVHVRVDRPGDSGFIPGETREGKIIDGRVDLLHKNASECSCGDLDSPDAYHVAVRVGLAG